MHHIVRSGAWRRQACAAVLVALAAACAPQQQRPLPAPPPPLPPRTIPVIPSQLPREKVQNKVGLLVPLTGPNAAVGRSIANAATLALTDLGSSNVNLRIYDTAPGASVAAKKALGDGVRLLLGPLLAGETRAVATAVAGRGVPVLAFTNDAGVAGGGTYVLGYQPGQAITRVVGYARSIGVEHFAGLIPAGVYGQRASTAYLRAVQAAGGRVVAMTTYTRTVPAMTAAARTVTGGHARGVALRPDGSVSTAAVAPSVPFEALLVADSGTTAASFAPVLARFGAAPGSARLLGTELWAAEPGIRTLASLKGALYAAVPETRYRQFAQRYRQRYNGSPSRLASFGYDGVLLVNALAGSWPLGAAFPTAALETPAGFDGLDGRFRFQNSIAERRLEVREIGGGTARVVSPAAGSFAE